MKKYLFITIIFLSIHFMYAQTAYTWNGSTSTAWNVATNWTPNGVPTAADYVTIVTGGNNCILAGNTTVTNLTITTGVLNLNGFTLNTTGAVACNGGTCNNGTFNSTATTLIFAGTTFGANITANVTDVYFNGSTFNGSISVTKNSGSNIQSTGNNTFNGVTSITNAGTGYLLLTNNSSKTDVFNGLTTFNTTNTGNLWIGYSGNINFNANVTVNNTAGTGGTYLGYNGVANLGSGITITCGTFAGGSLNLNKLNQAGSTALTLSPGNSGGVNITKSTINGALTVNAGLVTAQTSTFNTTVNYNIGGTINNAWSSGGNVYNGILTVNNSSNGYTGFANGTGDTYNADVYANNTSSTGGRIIFGNNSTSQFNGNVYVSSSSVAGGAGIAIGWGGAYPIIQFAVGKKVIVSGTFDSGYLQLFKIQQSDATAFNITTTGTAQVYLQQNIFLGNVNVSSPDIYPYGGTYNAPVVFTKTGGVGGNHNNGYQNTFNGTCTINQQSTSGYFMLGYNSNDLFNDNITVTNTGTREIYLGYPSGTGNPTLASGKTVLVGGAGFGSGTLYFGNFTQLGSTPINLTLTGTAGCYISRNTSGTSTFNAAFNITAPDIYVQGGTFNGAAVFTKTGGTSNHNNGYQNIFNGTCTINQQSTSGYFMLGYNSNDLFNDNITVTNTGTREIYLGHPSGTGNPTLASGKTVLVGGAGFASGTLCFGNFTQLGSTPINLTLTGTAGCYISRNTSGTSTFNAAFNITAPDIYVQGGTFNGAAAFTKTGGTSNNNNGYQNIFNGTCTINQQSTSGYFMLGYNSNDLFNDNITVTNTGTREIYLGFPSGTGNPTLASGKTVLVGGAGFASGTLCFGGFTQLGSTPINLTLTGTAGCYVSRNTSGTSTFNAAFNITAPDIYVQGGTFNGAAVFTKTGGASNHNNGYQNIFNGTCTINQQSTSGYFALGYNSNDLFNDNITVTNTGTREIYLGYSSGTGTPTLASGKTVLVGGAGFASGALYFGGFTQLGNAPINLTLGNLASLIFINHSVFGGNVTSISGTLLFNGCTFNGTANCTKNGSTNDGSSGNNIFNGVTTIINSGSGYLLLGNTNSDQFNNTATFNNIGTSNLFVAYNSPNNTFGGVTTFNNAPSSGNYGVYVSGYSPGTIFNDNIIVTSTTGAGVQFCYGNATATATLATGKTISIGGAGFTAGYLMLKQFTQLGATPQTLVQTSGMSILQLGPTSTFNGNVNFSFPQVLLNGTTYNGTTTIEKNGATDNYGTGGNIFNGTTIITNSGSGYLLTGGTNADLFNGVTTMNNTGSYRIYFAHNHGGQTTTFTQPLTLNSNKSGGADVWSYFICEGANTNVIFNDVTINIAGTLQSYMRLLQGSASTAIFNGNLTVNLTNTNASGTQVQLGTVGTTTYNGNITLNSTTGSANGGVYFNVSGSATSTLTAGHSIGLGASGFTSGNLSMPRFTQISNTPQTLVQTSGTAILTSGPTSSFDGNVNFNFPQIYLNGAVYNNTASFEKNGAAINVSVGGNTFNGATTIKNSHATDLLRLANSTADAYNSDVTMVQASNGALQPNYNTNCTYAGNITVTSPAATAITFGGGSGIATLNNGSAQTINRTGSSAFPVFTRLVVNKSANDVTLNTRINISTYLTLTQGIINTTATNILNMNNASTTTIGNALSYINGPMNYDMAFVGTRTLNFPIGKVADWRPAVLTLTHNNGTSYTYNAELTNSSANALGWTLPPTVNLASLVHWWDITRTNTSTGIVTPTLNLSGNQTITLYYDVNDGVTVPGGLTILKNTYTAPTAWIDIGGSGATVTTGNVTSTSLPSAFNSFSRFTLGNKSDATNPLPIELLYFTATPVDNKTVDLNWATATERNNSRYEIERSIDGINFEYVTTVSAYNNGNSSVKQTYHTIDEKPYKGISYYRLKQIDVDGTYKRSDIVSVIISDKSFINFFPNPTSDKLYVNYSKDYMNAQVKILNSLGAVIVNETNITDYNGQIDLSDLADGIYYLLITQGEKVSSVKISIQK